METKKIIILGAMAVLGFGVFYAMKNLGAPAPAIYQRIGTPTFGARRNYFAIKGDFCWG